jgi:hypothetical protein
MANQPSPVLNIRCSCMVQMPSHIWMLYFEGLQSQQYESSHCPHPPLQAGLPPLCMAALPSPVWKRTLVWLNYHTFLKSKGETCMVQEPSHVKQLSPIHVCKIGLRCKQSDFLPIIFHCYRLTPVANLPLVLLTPVENCHRYQWHQRYQWQNWPPMSLIPVVHLDLQIFLKVWNDPHVIFRGLGEDDSWKKP